MSMLAYIFLISIVLFMIMYKYMENDNACCTLFCVKQLVHVDGACNFDSEKINILEYASREGLIQKRTLCTLS